MIKLRIEGKPVEIVEILEILQEEYKEDLEVSGLYELDHKRSRAYIDIEK